MILKVVILLATINAFEIFSHPYIEVIKEFEGYYAEPYFCPAGKRTIGYGHVIVDGETYKKLTKFQAELLLAKDLAEHIFELEKVAPEIMDDPDKVVAITSFIFNLGMGNFKSSTLLKRIKEKDWDSAANEILRWNKCTDPKTGEKRVLKGLDRRRKSESALFRNGTVTM